MKPISFRDIFKKDFIAAMNTRVSSMKITQFIRDILKKDSVVGLDIGASSVKMAQFVKKEDGFHLVRADLKEIGSVDNESLREKKIVEILKDLLMGVDKNKSKIIVSINCPHTATKRVIVPLMPKQELRDGINLEAKNYFPFPINSSPLDYEILGDIVEKGLKKYEVAVSVSPKETVDTYLSLLGKAGVKPAALVPCPVALQKLAEASYVKEGRAMCFIDIGELETELIIFKGKKLIFSRKIPVAGKDITRAMTGALVSDRGKIELTFDEAEKIKQAVGIPSEPGPKIINDKISTVQILSMLRAPLEQLVNEIERCFDYYIEKCGGGKIDSLVLFGGGASLGGLTKFLSSELGIEVKLGEPLEGLKGEPDVLREKSEISHRLAVAIGAALSETRGINLLPPELKEETKRTFQRTTFEVVACVVILVLTFIYIGMKITLNNYQKKVSVAKLELSSLEPQLQEARIFSLLVDEPSWGDVFKELSNLVPNDVYLTNLSMKDKVITIRGIVSQEQGEECISNFILTLGKGKGIFKGVKLLTTKETRGKVDMEFILSCGVE